MRVIGFGHKARQGKSTAAFAMLEACPLDTEVRMYAFADALRTEVRLACAKLGGQYDLIESFKGAGLMPEWVRFEEGKPRSLLQWWGTEYRRAKDPDYWVTRLEKTLSAHQPDVALITDVRYPNEAEAVKRWGGTLVRVIRDGEPDYAVSAHESESALDGYEWDYTLTAKTKPELVSKARALFAVLELGK